MASEFEPIKVGKLKFVRWGPPDRDGERALDANNFVMQREALDYHPNALKAQSKNVSQRTGGSRSRPPQLDFGEASPRLRVLRRQE